MFLSIACLIIYAILMLTTFTLLGISLFNKLTKYEDISYDNAGTIESDFDPTINKSNIDLPIYIISLILSLISFGTFAFIFKHHNVLHKKMGIVCAFFLSLISSVGQLLLSLIHKGKYTLFNISFILSIINTIFSFINSGIVWANINE